MSMGHGAPQSGILDLGSNLNMAGSLGLSRSRADPALVQSMLESRTLDHAVDKSSGEIG